MKRPQGNFLPLSLFILFVCTTHFAQASDYKILKMHQLERTEERDCDRLQAAKEALDLAIVRYANQGDLAQLNLDLAEKEEDKAAIQAALTQKTKALEELEDDLKQKQSLLTELDATKERKYREYRTCRDEHSKAYCAPLYQDYKDARTELRDMEDTVADLSSNKRDAEKKIEDLNDDISDIDNRIANIKWKIQNTEAAKQNLAENTQAYGKILAEQGKAIDIDIYAQPFVGAADFTGATYADLLLPSIDKSPLGLHRIPSLLSVSDASALLNRNNNSFDLSVSGASIAQGVEALFNQKSSIALNYFRASDCAGANDTLDPQAFLDQAVILLGASRSFAIQNQYVVQVDFASLERQLKALADDQGYLDAQSLQNAMQEQMAGIDIELVSIQNNSETSIVARNIRQELVARWLSTKALRALSANYSDCSNSQYFCHFDGWWLETDASMYRGQFPNTQSISDVNFALDSAFYITDIRKLPLTETNVVPSYCAAPLMIENGQCVDPTATPNCETDETLVNGVCEKITCPEGQSLVEGVCQNDDVDPGTGGDPQCEEGEVFVDGKCTEAEAPTCPEGSVLEEGECVVPAAPSCPQGTVLIDGVCSTAPSAGECPERQALVAGVCKTPLSNACGESQVNVQGVCVNVDVSECRVDQMLVYGVCLNTDDCPDNMAFSDDIGLCVPSECPQGSTLINGAFCG